MYAKYGKRILDAVLAFCALTVLSPVLLVLIVLGAVMMKGNPFFTQLRPGSVPALGYQNDRRGTGCRHRHHPQFP